MLKCVHERHHASEPRPLLEALASIVLTASSLGCLASRGARSAAEYPVQRLRRYEELGAEPDEERHERQGDDNARKYPERRGDHRRIRHEWSAVRLQQHIARDPHFGLRDEHVAQCQPPGSRERRSRALGAAMRAPSSRSRPWRNSASAWFSAPATLTKLPRRVAPRPHASDSWCS